MRSRTKYLIYFLTYIILNCFVFDYLFRKIISVKTTRKESGMKYILQWTSPLNCPFVFMGQGQEGFTRRNCTHTNCFVTGDRTYLDLEEFDAIAFDLSSVTEMTKDDLPTRRSEKQKYIFIAVESSDRYPVCNKIFDGFFNMTWTYRLESDVRFGYITVKDSEGKIIGPNINMHWLSVGKMLPLSKELKDEFKTKSKAAVWFVSNCKTRSHREVFVEELKKELKKYNLSVDVFGDCGELKCPLNHNKDCHQLIKDTYYFYLAFENSLSVDYVTEKILHGLQYNAIPVVFGGANYTRFMPDGIYLNARKLGVRKLAKKMHNLIKNPDKYFEFFKWRNHYSFSSSLETPTNDFCNLCAALNNYDFIKKKKSYKNLRLWWNERGRCEKNDAI